jgi:predicted amidophosphoribosyltransferase
VSNVAATMPRRSTRIPPLTFCRDCGREQRSWTPGKLCDACVRRLTSDPVESLRAFRRRAVDPFRDNQ